MFFLTFPIPPTGVYRDISVLNTGGDLIRNEESRKIVSWCSQRLAEQHPPRSGVLEVEELPVVGVNDPSLRMLDHVGRVDRSLRH